MNSLLQKAVRKVSEKVGDAAYRLDDAEMDSTGLREARDLIRVLANIAGGMDMRKAFGAPGDWGYGNELGQGVLQMLNSRAGCGPESCAVSDRGNLA